MSLVDSLGKMYRRKPDGAKSRRKSSGSVRKILDEEVDSVSADSSVLSEYGEGDFADQDMVVLPVLGRAAAAQHHRRLLLLLLTGLVVLALIAGWALQRDSSFAGQLAATGQSLMQSQRLAKSVTQAVTGHSNAFAEVTESAKLLADNFEVLQKGVAAQAFEPQVNAIAELVQRAENSASIVTEQQQTLIQVGAALRTISAQSEKLVEVAETVFALKQEQNAPVTEMLAAAELVTLTQRIGNAANEFRAADSTSAENASNFRMAKDLGTFKEIAQGLLDGDNERRLTAARDARARAQIGDMLRQYEQMRTQISAVAGGIQALRGARAAQDQILADSEPLRSQLEALQVKLLERSGVKLGLFAGVVLVGLFVLLCGVGIFRVQLLDSRNRQAAAEVLQRDARRPSRHFAPYERVAIGG